MMHLFEPGQSVFPHRLWSIVNITQCVPNVQQSFYVKVWMTLCFQRWPSALNTAGWGRMLQICPILWRYNLENLCVLLSVQHFSTQTSEHVELHAWRCRFSRAELRVGHSNSQITNRVLPLFRSLHLHGGVLWVGGGGYEAFAIQMQMGELSAAKTWWIMGCTKSRALNEEMKEGLFSTPLISL